MKFLKLIAILCLPLFLIAQPPADRYQAALFTDVLETNDVLFSTNVPQPNPGGGFYETITGFPLNVDEYNTSPVNLFMDIFEPVGDTLSERPLIIIAFGGGYLSGSRDHWSIRAMCEELAKQGYVTASIDYRLGMNVFDSDLANRAVYRGLQDMRSAVRFFRADAAGANIYKIAPDKIFLGGHSSGAFSALHNVYLEKETERPLSTYTWTQDGNVVADQGCLDCVGDNQSFSGLGNGLFSLAGALGFTDFIETANDPKPVLFHSTDDGTVPYDSGTPFSSILWLVVGADLPTVYGSLPISVECTSVGLPYEFYQYTNRGHGVHENVMELYDDIIPGISDWFFTEELQPTSGSITGANVICPATLAQSYQLAATDAVYFDWQLTGGTFSSMNTNSSTVSVSWDAAATEHELFVIPYSASDAKGDSIFINISLFDAGENIFKAVSNSWMDAGNWSLGHVPTLCEDVTIEALGINALLLTQATEINSLFVADQLKLEVSLGGDLLVQQKNVLATDHALDVAGEVKVSGTLIVKNVVTGMEIQVRNGGKIEVLGSGAVGED